MRRRESSTVRAGEWRTMRPSGSAPFTLLTHSSATPPGLGGRLAVQGGPIWLSIRPLAPSSWGFLAARGAHRNECFLCGRAHTGSCRVRADLDTIPLPFRGASSTRRQSAEVRCLEITTHTYTIHMHLYIYNMYLISMYIYTCIYMYN